MSRLHWRLYPPTLVFGKHFEFPRSYFLIMRILFYLGSNEDAMKRTSLAKFEGMTLNVLH